VCLVLTGGPFTVCNVLWRQWQQSAAFHAAQCYVSVGEEGVELFHEIFAYEVGEVYLVQWVTQNREENILKMLDLNSKIAAKSF